MDAAVARMPECPECGYGVDENAPELPSCVIDGVLYHAKCCTTCRDELPGNDLEELLHKSLEMTQRKVATPVTT